MQMDFSTLFSIKCKKIRGLPKVRLADLACIESTDFGKAFEYLPMVLQWYPAHR